MGIIEEVQDIYVDEDFSLSDTFMCTSVASLAVKTHWDGSQVKAEFSRFLVCF